MACQKFNFLCFLEVCRPRWFVRPASVKKPDTDKTMHRPRFLSSPDRKSPRLYHRMRAGGLLLIDNSCAATSIFP